MNQTQFYFATCLKLQWCCLVGAISSYFFSVPNSFAKKANALTTVLQTIISTVGRTHSLIGSLYSFWWPFRCKCRCKDPFVCLRGKNRSTHLKIHKHNFSNLWRTSYYHLIQLQAQHYACGMLYNIFKLNHLLGDTVNLKIF